jgi:hypothetical protein
MSRGFEAQSVEAMGGSREPKSASALRTMGKFGPGPKASKVWNKFPWSSKAYSKAFLSLKPVKTLGLRANTVQLQYFRFPFFARSPLSVAL